MIPTPLDPLNVEHHRGKEPGELVERHHGHRREILQLNGMLVPSGAVYRCEA
jgi:hypothetical protein